MTETPIGRDGSSAAGRSADPAPAPRVTRHAVAGRKTPVTVGVPLTGDRPRRPHPAPVTRPGLPADTLAMLLLLVVIILVLSLGAFAVR